MKLLILIMLPLIFNGCASSYTCADFPEGKCQTVSDVYNQNKSSSPGLPTISASSMVSSEESLQSKPILKGPQVLRVLLGSWEDEDKDLNVGGYIYIKIKEAQWEL